MAQDPSVLVVRFSAIGDCVMTAWAATAIRERHPKSQITWAVESRCADVIDRANLVSEVAEFPRDRWKKSRWSPRVWREQMVAFTRLRSVGFDLGYDLQGHGKTALCLRLARPTRRIAAGSTDALSRRLNPQAPPRPEGTHTVDWNHTVLNCLSEFVMPQRPIMPEVPKRTASGRLVTISVSAGRADKAYPLEMWGAVARELKSRGDRVAFLGGPTDPHPDIQGVEDFVGKLRVGETMALVAQSDAHLAADTGTGHMAAAYGVPVVSVFGPLDPRVFRPYTNRGKVLRRSSNPGDIAPSEILEAMEELLGSPISHQ